MNVKKALLILGVLIILIGVIIGLLFAFLGIYNSSQNLTVSTTVDTLTGDPVAYLKESWQFHDAQRNVNENSVTAIRIYDLSYEDAKKIGNRVFVDDLSPESYLSQALTIAADLSSRFSMDQVTVIISFRTNDGNEIFSVDSKGNISTCWSTEE